MPELDEDKQQRGEAWAKGDYSSLGSRLTIVGELLCEAADLRSDWAVLDVATGPGNTALAAARRGCRVTGVDISKGLLEIASQRAAAEGLDVSFIPGDAEDLSFPDASFDAVTSSFGAMFAPSPERAADEMLRVCRPGGVIALANWSPEGANAVEDRVIASYTGEAGSPSPWSTREGLRGLLGERVADLRIERRDLIFRFASVTAYVDTLMQRFGPFIGLVESLPEEARTGLRNDLVEGLTALNQSGDDTMVVPFPYLEVVARTHGAGRG